MNNNPAHALAGEVFPPRQREDNCGFYYIFRPCTPCARYAKIGKEPFSSSREGWSFYKWELRFPTFADGEPMKNGTAN